MSATGRLTLVGAGPGDPDLITLKGVKVIASAEVLLYDALVNKELLKHAATHCEKIYVGKRAGSHSANQEKINKLIVEHALKGKHVVRLKGGDPFIFARGKEELEYAETFDIETDFVLGISSINLPGYYGIPLTKRGINESFWAVTATTKNGRLSKDVVLVAQSTATAVFFMGLGKLEEISAIYTEYGKEDKPAAIISKGSLEDGQAYFSTVKNLANIRDDENIAAPALIVIGEAVASHELFYEKVRELNKNYK